MWKALLIFALVLTACGRPLTTDERAFAQKIHGDSIDLDRVRLARGALVGAVTFRRPARPRVSCRERILPPPKTDIITTRPAAVVLFNRIHFTRDWYIENYMPLYPERLYLIEAMLLAHELTHVWQWQNRDVTGYHPLRAAAEHQRSADPYLFETEDEKNFLDYGFEQQGAIVEEYVCCRALAPDAARTERLHQMLSAAFPVSRLPDVGRESDVVLPWKEAELNGICD
ncbi:hypothetical protein [Thalassococcus sp. S3]|uniref:hypothetical protein n=1 Tax=Thalassococcus sp. S3 TaxID=2017482 RepID=UPI0010241E51|nr:hypothetical protein [Thalassococcus sp. S3]QBF32828.1 hypothetical protein CFI11_16610 [Thalassococcus sp. S3]